MALIFIYARLRSPSLCLLFPRCRPVGFNELFDLLVPDHPVANAQLLSRKTFGRSLLELPSPGFQGCSVQLRLTILWPQPFSDKVLLGGREGARLI